MTTTETRAGREPLVVLDDVSKHYPVRGGLLQSKDRVRSVDGVSLAIRPGEVLGLVGESGCGKSTLARLILHLVPLTGGRILFDGREISGLNRRDLKGLRREMQIVFQDPFAALDPRMPIGTSVEVPLGQHGVGSREERRSKVVELLEQVGLDDSLVDRLPRKCSGGQLQRVVIARALALGPRFLVCDEPTSALDASVRGQILNLLVELKERLGLTMLIISHDLRVVRYMSDRVAVMYLGQIVELADKDELFDRPLHPYTQALMAAAVPEEASAPAPARIKGEPPSPIRPPAGCRFHPRCPRAQANCQREAPPLEEVRPGHWVSCHYWDQETLDQDTTT